MATITSAATGNWSAGATWVGGSAPASGDDVVVTGAHDIAIDANPTTCASLTTTTYSGTLTQNAGQAFTVNGDIAWSGGTFTGGDSTIISQTFSLTGTATWTSTSVAFEIGLPTTYQGDGTTVTPLLTSGLPTFTHNSGTVSLNGQGYTINTRNLSIASVITFNNFYITGGSSYHTAAAANYRCTYDITGAANIITTGHPCRSG